MCSGKMVATRRGARGTPATRNTDNTGTDSTVRTRSRTVVVSEQSQSGLTCDSKQDDAVETTTPKIPPKRETRRTKPKPTDANHPDSTHEADVSGSESCCSDIQTEKTPRSKRRAVGRARPTAAAEQEASEGESCTSKPCRSTRSQKKTALVPSQLATSQDSDHSESCSSVVSLSKVIETRRITRSRRKVVPSEDADSCSSAVSGPQLSTVRRSTRNCRTKPIAPIPIHLEESEPAEASVSSALKRTRASKGKVKSAAEDQIYDSEGCRSGPSTSPQRIAGFVIFDSDSEVLSNTGTSLDSPCSIVLRHTPCSSRTGSASSSHAMPASRTRSKTRVMRDVASVAFTSETLESEPEKDQIEASMDTVSTAVSDQENAEEMEDVNRTVIIADVQECSEDVEGELTLTLEDDDDDDDDQHVVSTDIEKIVESQNRQETSIIRGVIVSENFEGNSCTEQPETEKGVKIMEVCVKIPEPAMETETELVHEVHDLDYHECSVLKPEGSVVVSEQEPTEPEKSVMTFGESAEKVETMEEKVELVADNDAVMEDQKLKRVFVSEEAEESEAVKVPYVSADQTVTCSNPTDEKVEDDRNTDLDPGCHEVKLQKNVHDVCSTLTDDDQPCSSKHQVFKRSAEQTKPVKGASTLLDSSEDEESDDGGLSDECCEDDAENEDEVMCSDENQPGPSEEPDSLNNNALFVIDTRPGLNEKYYVDTTRHEVDGNVDDSEAVEDEDSFVDEEDEDEDEDSKVLFSTRRPALMGLSSTIDPGIKVKELGGLYITFDGCKSKSGSSNLKQLKDQKNQNELLKNSVIVSDFEKKDAVPPYKESKHTAKLKRKEERDKTTGDGWFNMRAPELTDELKNDLKALKMRSAMDPKRFYKKNDRQGFPKYFQVGTVVDNPVDFYHSRIPKKQRKRTIVEELLVDAEFRSFNKRKYKEIMAETSAKAAGKLKKNSFRKKKM